MERPVSMAMSDTSAILDGKLSSSANETTTTTAPTTTSTTTPEIADTCDSTADTQVVFSDSGLALECRPLAGGGPMWMPTGLALKDIDYTINDGHCTGDDWSSSYEGVLTNLTNKRQDVWIAVEFYNGDLRVGYDEELITALGAGQSASFEAVEFSDQVTSCGIVAVAFDWMVLQALLS